MLSAFPDYDCLSSACLPAHPCLLMGLSLAAQTFHQCSGTSTVCLLMITNAQHLTLWCVLVCLLSLSMLFTACPALCPKLKLPPSNTGAIGVCCQVMQASLVCRKQACSCVWHLVWATVRWEITWPVCSSSSGAVDTGMLLHRLHSAALHHYTQLALHHHLDMISVKQVAAAKCTTV